MITRRRFVGSAASVLALSKIRPLLALQDAANSGADFTHDVNIFIGTGGHGHCYPGASVPFGMVQLSPDTYNDEWDWCSGYHLSDSSIMGFSHTHLSGTGAADMLDILLMPGTGEAKMVPGSREHPEEGYRSRFSHQDESATPGYYSVFLKDYKVRAELTATERVGVHRYTFPQAKDAHFILDLAHRYGQPTEKKNALRWSKLSVVGNDTVVGGRSTDIWAKGRQIYFAMQFSRPFKSWNIVAGQQRLDPSVRDSDANGVKCLLFFDTKANEPILVKAGLSGVSAELALKNLRAEVPDWNFERVRRSAHDKWKRELSRVAIEADPRVRQIFYTGLYHSMLAPTLFDDVDGSYRGMDNQVHQAPSGMHNYSTYSLWDTYRALHPLYTLMLPERVPDLVNGLIRMTQESPAGPPIWPLQGEETFCMTGYHSVSVIAEALNKGFKGIDAGQAYASLKKRAFADDYEGLAYYRKLNYIPADKIGESTSKTQDYCYDDWAIAHVARAAGAMDDYGQLLRRSTNYRNLFDKQSRFIRPKLEDGKWAEPFDPKSVGHSKQWRDFTESNSWQGTFANQHDLHAYIDLFGGRDAFVQKLDELFNQSSQLPPDAPPDIAGLIGQYAHGNEPSHHIAYLYAYAGAPWKTQQRVRQILDTLYDNKPDGLAGNEDCGQMSAWYIMSALGFYAVDPVSANYVIGSPVIDRASIDVGNGKRLNIEVKRGSPQDKHVQSVRLNGAAHEQCWFRHSDLANGATVVFEMGSQPNQRWASSPGAAPPSMTLPT
ncbi:MAG TPA: GH92 family glycosyl hydrolase [Terriglobales bacterium]